MPLIPSNMNPTTTSSATGILGAAPSKSDWINLLTGKKLTESTNDNTSFSKKDLPQNHRIVEEGGVVTMDHNPDRMNVHVDKDGVVKNVTHG